MTGKAIVKRIIVRALTPHFSDDNLIRTSKDNWPKFQSAIQLQTKYYIVNGTIMHDLIERVVL